MKRQRNFFLLLVLTTLGCHSPEPDSSGITGRWMMYKVYQNGQDVTKEHNPEGERFLLLKEDGTFESGGRPFGKNSGTYTFLEEENKLFLDSDTGEEDDSRWLITVKGDTMRWQGIGAEWAEGFRLVHIREGEK